MNGQQSVETDGAVHPRPNVAVASLEGVLVNLHLGEAAAFQIWTQVAGGEFVFLEERAAPEPVLPDRWERLARTLYDCRAVLVAALGQMPSEILSGQGIVSLEMEGLVEDGLRAVYSGKEIRPLAPRKVKGCCRGGGSGEGC
jgi:nitrogen fixation protein NifB